MHRHENSYKGTLRSAEFKSAGSQSQFSGCSLKIQDGRQENAFLPSISLAVNTCDVLKEQKGFISFHWTCSKNDITIQQYLSELRPLKIGM